MAENIIDFPFQKCRKPDQANEKEIIDVVARVNILLGADGQLFVTSDELNTDFICDMLSAAYEFVLDS